MKWVVGIDEVGRGPLAGPVCVCAAAMSITAYRKKSQKKSWKLGSVSLNDSKKMTARARECWEKEARALQKAGKLRIGLSMRAAAMIDRSGIASCIRSCIATALRQLDLDPADCTVLLDGGLKASTAYRRQQTIIRGDSAHPIISLASVVAKVTRDTHMMRLHRTRLDYAVYAWDHNKGYGTLAHRKALNAHGLTPIHRKTFIHKGF